MNIDLIIFRRASLVKRRILPGLFVFLLLSLFALGVLYEQVDAQSRVDQARRVDVIVVLGCSVWPGGVPSPALAARTEHAIALYQEGYASHLILTGGVGDYSPAEAQVMRRLAAAAGVPADALVLEEDSHSTEENLGNAKQLMDRFGWRSALVVSDPFHLFRAGKIARDLGMQVYTSPASDSPTYTIPHLRVWYTTRETLAVVWYYATRILGEPVWLYQILKGKL